MSVKSTQFISQWAPKWVPVLSYTVTIGMILAALGMALGSAVMVVLFGEMTLGGFGFLGAVVCGGQGLLGLLRQLNMSYCQQQVSFQPGS